MVSLKTNGERKDRKRDKPYLGFTGHRLRGLGWFLFYRSSSCVLPVDSSWWWCSSFTLFRSWSSSLLWGRWLCCLSHLSFVHKWIYNTKKWVVWCDKLIYYKGFIFT